MLFSKRSQARRHRMEGRVSNSPCPTCGNAHSTYDRPADGWRWRWLDQQTWHYQRREPQTHDLKIIEPLWTRFPSANPSSDK